MRRLVPLAACLLMAAACGGSSNHFASQADAVCARYKPRATAIDKKLSSDLVPHEVARELGQLETLLGQLHDELRRLTPPPAKRRLVSHFLAKLDILRTNLTKLRRSAQTGDLKTFQK